MEEPARHTDLVRLSDERGWLQVWTALLLATGRDVDVDREIRRLVDDRSREEESVLRRLDRIARSVAERGGGRRAMSLSDESASRLYTRFPNLLRTAFRDRIRASGHGYVRLLDAAIHRDDAELVDFIASRVVRIDTRQDWTRTEISPMLESLCAHYEALDRDNGELAVRAARVLGRVHPGDVPRRGYELIADHNRLADLLVRQPLETYLAAPASVRDLLESPDVHARLLAFRILAEDNDRAREIAVDSLDTLRAALFERMPCRVRVQALRALRNAAVNEDLARAIVASARDACDLPAGGYPMEALISLIGHLIHRYPALRGFAEEPAVFAGAPS